MRHVLAGARGLANQRGGDLCLDRVKGFVRLGAWMEGKLLRRNGSSSLIVLVGISAKDLRKGGRSQLKGYGLVTCENVDLLIRCQVYSAMGTRSRLIDSMYDFIVMRDSSDD